MITQAMIYEVYMNFSNWQDANGIEDSYATINEIELFIKAEQFTAEEVMDKDYMEDKFEIWMEML